MIDAIVTLGRGIEHDGTLTPDSFSRVKKAVELYKNGVSSKIIMSGAYSRSLKKIPAMTEASAMKKCAIELGCNPDDITEESRSTHTLANAYFTKKLICEKNGWYDLVIIASDEHMKRVQYLFKKVFGTSYRLEFIESDRVINDEQYQKELEHEKSSMEMSQKWLDEIKDGDDDAIQRLVASNIPDDTMADPL